MCAAVAVAFADSSMLALPELYVRFDTSIVAVSSVITSYSLVLAVCAFGLVPVLKRVDVGAVSRAGFAAFCGGSMRAATVLQPQRSDRFGACRASAPPRLLASSLALLAALSQSRTRGVAI